MKKTSLNIISAGAAMGLMQQLLSDQVSIRVGENFGAVRTMYDLFVTGVPCDLLILTRQQLDELNVAGCLVADSLHDIGHVKTGIAVRASTAESPDISNVESLKATLLNASSLYVPDMKQSTAGQHVAGMLAKLGIAEALANKISEHPNGAMAMRGMSESQKAHPIGCTQVTEILYTPSVRLVGLLPPAFELSTVYSIAVPKRSTHPEAALAAITKVCGVAQLTVREAAGFSAA
jgi:molybdate transport system substrate-binding protein